jgi:hypothetical protein
MKPFLDLKPEEMRVGLDLNVYVSSLCPSFVG